MATLVNGNGNPAVYAQQDADLYVGVMGTTSCIMSVGSKFAATIETANLISVADGVILTKEGRRIQTDVGEVDEFNIPNGAAGVTRYYIIGYHLYTDGQGSQKCETFVQLMANATDTIPEAEFRNGATEVYVSLYRVTQVGLTLNDPVCLLPDALNIGDINASLTEKVTQKEGNISVEGSTISSTALDWVTWDETNGRMILHKKGTGADAGFPFSGGKIKEYLTFSNRPYSYGGYQVVGGLFITDSLTVIPDGTSTDDFLQMQDLLSAYHFYSTSTITISKEGYYIINESAVTHHDIGDIVSGGTYATIWNIFYLGETNPFA